MAVGGRRPSKADPQTLRILRVKNVAIGQKETSTALAANFRCEF